MADKPKYVRFGTVLKSKKSEKNPEGKGSFIALGQSNPKAPQYDVDVEVTVRRRDSGEVLAQQTNGFVSCFDPRLSDNEERASKVPDSVLFELSLKLAK